MRSIYKSLFKTLQNVGFVATIATLLLSSLTINVYAVPIDHESPPCQLSTAKANVVRPHPNHSPDDVIRFQVEAFARNNTPYTNAGIAIAFRFTSPSSKKVTGPLRHFGRIASNPLYRPILNHRIAHYGELRLKGDKAVQIVLLTTSDGDRVGYLFSLSKQKSGYYVNCWMTDSVLLLPRFQEA